VTTIVFLDLKLGVRRERGQGEDGPGEGVRD